MIAYRIERHDRLLSTNAVVKEALRVRAPEGLVVCARAQSGGYGRQGRTWESPEGGLYCSLLLRPDVELSQLPTLGLVVALAVREALTQALPEEASCARVQVKWPNDVVIREGAVLKKLCGISLEACAGGVCLGIGVNVAPPEYPISIGGKYAPAYARDEGMACEVDEVLDQVLAIFSTYYETWQREGFAAFLAEYRSCAALVGERIEVVALDGAVLAVGSVQGVDEQGRLLLATDNGVMSLSSGEVHLR